MTTGHWPRISSRPPWWGQTWVAVVLIAFFWPPIDHKDWLAVLWVGGLGTLFSLMFALFAWLEHRLGAIEIFDGRDHLGLRQGFQKDVLPLTQIESITYTRKWPQGVLTLWLKSPCRFGKDFDFTVEHKISASGLHSLSEMLWSRITKDHLEN